MGLVQPSMWAPTRPRAVERLRRALAEYDIRGLTTNLEFLRRLVDVPSFIEGRYDTGFIEQHRRELLDAPSAGALDERVAAAALIVSLSADGQGHERPRAATATKNGSNSASEWRQAHRRQRLGF